MVSPEGQIRCHAPLKIGPWLHAGEYHSPPDCAAQTERDRSLLYIRDPPYVIGPQLTCHVLDQLVPLLGRPGPSEYFSTISRKLSKICQIFIYGSTFMLISSWPAEKIQHDSRFYPIEKC
jgi:hypothetical protein